MKEVEESIDEIWKKAKEEFKALKKKKRKKIKKKNRPKERHKHCKMVCKITQVISKKLKMSTSIVKELEVAAELHDIKKFDYDRDHAENGADYIRNNFKVENLDINNIYEIVKHHKSSKPGEEDSLNSSEQLSSEIKKAIFIIRVADKLSKKDYIIEENIYEVVNEVYANSINNIVTKEEKEEVINILNNYYILDFKRLFE